ncbi:hypothetical protein Taro_011343 [Colocasia esculenta]|uniref:phosphoserine phosphatase n=1 Tax=Colocasia esculenta TaxID=4460 RepID=A0A843UAD4_COLES|nr:hypothetical protein [Colocasia esculenta]
MSTELGRPGWRSTRPTLRKARTGEIGPFKRVSPAHAGKVPTAVPRITPISSHHGPEFPLCRCRIAGRRRRPPELRCFRSCTLPLSPVSVSPCPERAIPHPTSPRVCALAHGCADWWTCRHSQPFMSSSASSRPFIVLSASRRLVKVSYQLPVGRSSRFCNLLTLVTCLQPSKTVESNQFDNVLPSEEVLEIWCNADAVCFDVDSTVCLDEGIDELADFCGAGKAVAEWTARAMTGSVPFEEALAARLSLFNPSLSQLHNFLEKRPPRISPGIDELIEKLRLKQTDVYLISGGFHQMIEL